MIEVTETAVPEKCFEIMLHPDVLRAQPGHWTKEEAELMAMAALTQLGARVYAVKKDGTNAGGIVLFPVVESNKGWDMHFCIVGFRGIAAESAKAVIEKLPAGSWVQCQVRKDDIRVNKVLDKIGFSKTAFPTWGQSGLSVRYFHSC